MSEHALDWSRRVLLESTVDRKALGRAIEFMADSSFIRPGAAGVPISIWDNSELYPELIRHSTSYSAKRIGNLSAPRDSKLKQNLGRQPSCRDFLTTAGFDVELLKKFLGNTFGESVDKPFQRNYPSAGAIYSVEVFAVVLAPSTTKSTHDSEGVLHYCSSTNEIVNINDRLSAKCFADICFDGHFSTGENTFSNALFAIVYVVDLVKAIHRYHERGLRFAMIEAGSMLQQASIEALNLGMRDCCFGGFPDNELIVAMGLDITRMSPLLVQVFGIDPKKSEDQR